MSLSGTTYALGRNQRLCARIESTLGTYLAPTAASSLRVRSGSFTPSETRKNRRDTKASRSAFERILGQRSVEYEFQTYCLPPGGANVPDVGPLVQAAMGTETIGGSSVAYGLTGSQLLPPSLSLTSEYNGVLAIGARGAVVSEMSLEIPGGGEEPFFTFRGMAIEALKAGQVSRAAGTLNIGATTFTCSPVDDNYLLDAGMLIQIGTDTNGGAGFTISSINRGTGVVTFTPALAIAQSSNVTVQPFTPFDEAQTIGQPVAGINGRIDIGSDTDLLIQSARVNVANNFGEIRPAFRNAVADYIPGWRDVTGEVTFWGRVADVRRWAYAQQLGIANVNPRAVTIRLGTLVTGQPELNISIPSCEFQFSAFELPASEEGGEASFTLPFVARSTVLANNDELTLTFQNS